jgi:hypothetical protein
MRHAHRALALSTLLLASATAGAQSSPLPSFEERTGWPLPQSGIYFDPAQPGVGFSFDVGLDGTLLGGIGSYGEDGRSIFYTVQGRITRDAQAPGTIGVLRSPVYLSRQVAAGQVATDTVPALGEAVVRFTEARRLTVEVAGQRWNMQRLALTEDPAQWLSGRFLMLAEPRADAGLAPPVLAQVSIGELQPVAVRAGAPEGGCGAATPPVAAREVVCETGCGAFQEWAGGRTARVLAWPNADSSTWQLGRFVPGNAGQWVPLPNAGQHTLEISHLSLDALPVARGCTAKAEPLRFYRRDVPQYVVQTPVGPAAVRYTLGSLRAGTWWDPTRPGRGLVIDVGGRTTAPRAFGMVGVFDFREDGSADFSTLQGAVESPNPGMLWPEALASPLYRHRDGQCIGCPWRAPNTRSDDAGVQLVFQSPNRGELAVHRMMGPRVVGSDLYLRFPLDRSPYEEPLGRWLLRIQDPALTGISTEFATLGQPIPAYAEVAIEPLEGAFGAMLAPLGPPYGLRCLRGCADFSRWVRGSARPGDTAERVAVLHFPLANLNPVRPNEGYYDPATAAVGIFTRGANGWVLVEDTPYYPLDLLQRDRYATIGEGYRGTNPVSGTPAGRIDLFRNPPRVLAD